MLSLNRFFSIYLDVNIAAVTTLMGFSMSLGRALDHCPMRCVNQAQKRDRSIGRANRSSQSVNQNLLELLRRNRRIVPGADPGLHDVAQPALLQFLQQATPAAAVRERVEPRPQQRRIARIAAAGCPFKIRFQSLLTLSKIVA